MHLEVIRTVKDWLAGDLLDFASVNQGVNAQLATVPRDAGDPVPENVAQFGDVTRDDWAARSEIPMNSPAIVVLAGTPAEVDGEVKPGPPGVRDARNLGVVIRYLRRDANTAKAMQDAAYTVRAIIKSLREMVRSANYTVIRRNNIAIRAQLTLVWGHPSEWEGASATLGAVLATYYVRDEAP